jgi:Protein kinase domain
VEGVGPGSRVAGYVVLEQVGRGGMAAVFRGRDEELGRVVALKVLASVLAEDEGFRQRFIQESRAAAAVDDPHIIPVYEAGAADGVLFIAMRFVGGGDVRSPLRRTGPRGRGGSARPQGRAESGVLCGAPESTGSAVAGSETAISRLRSAATIACRHARPTSAEAVPTGNGRPNAPARRSGGSARSRASAGSGLPVC